MAGQHATDGAKSGPRINGWTPRKHEGEHRGAMAGRVAGQVRECLERGDFAGAHIAIDRADSQMPRRVWAARYGVQVQICLEGRRFDGARAAIDRAELDDPDHGSEPADLSLEETFDLSLAELGVSNRTCTALEELGVITLRDLTGWDVDDIKAIPNCGDKVVAELQRALKRAGVPRQKMTSAAAIAGGAGDSA